MSGNIFISYRRQDAGDIAGRIADRLRELPQVDDVFLDVENIGFGENFVSKINNVIARSDICLLLIGPQWHGPREGAGPRIKEPEDFVRMEAVAALRSDIKTVPVLLQGADMPGPGLLPEDLSGLPFLNGFPIRTAFFSNDIEILFDDLFGADREKPDDSLIERFGGRALRGLISAVLGLVLLVAIALVYQLTTGNSLSLLFDDGSAIGSYAMVGFLLVLFPAIGFFIGFRKRKRKRA